VPRASSVYASRFGRTAATASKLVPIKRIVEGSGVGATADDTVTVPPVAKAPPSPYGPTTGKSVEHGVDPHSRPPL
jgi:hypothetical protein